VVKQAGDVRQRIGVTFQEMVLDDELTGRQVLDYHGRLYRMGKAERETKIEELLALVELEEAAERKAKTYSGGMKRRLSAEAFNALSNHVLPYMGYRLAETKAGRVDTITRGAPAMLLFHAPRGTDGSSEDALVALTYGLLAAHALGLGATAIGLVPPVVERSAELRDLFQIPAGHKVLACLIAGYPRIRFKRAIRRELPAVHWI
jgi:nitroreductase